MDTTHTFVAGNLIPMLGNIVKALPQAFVQFRNLINKELSLIGENSDEIMQGGITLVKDFATAIVSSIPYFGEAVFKLISSFGNTILNTDWLTVATDIITELKDCLDVAAGEIFESDGNILDALIHSINTGLPKVLEQGVEFVTNLSEGVLSAIPNLLEIGGGIVEQVYTCIMQNAPKFWESGTELLLNIVNGITEQLPTIVETAVTVVDNLLNTIFENAPQMLDAGIEVLEQLLNGIWNALPQILYAAADLVVELLKTVLKYAPKLIEGGITLLGKLAAGLVKAIPELLTKIPTIISNIREKFLSINWGEVGWNIIKGIAKGLLNAASEIVKAMKEVAAKALSSFKEKLGIHSPSRVFEDEGGKEIDRGVAKGITKNISTIIDSMKEMSRATIGAFDADFSYHIDRFFGTDDAIKTEENQPIVIHNYTTLDGRTIARSTAEYLDGQLMWEAL